MPDQVGQFSSKRLDRRTLLITAAATAAALPFSAIAAQSGLPRAVSDASGVRLRQRSLSTRRHRTAYVEAGPADGAPMIFLHGHSELGISWRSQIELFAAAGCHCVAPDMRGHGGSSVPESSESYTMREIVRDMTELHDSLGGTPAVWVGCGSGSAVVWQLAATEGRRCRAVANLDLPYFPTGFDRTSTVPHVDRRFSPLDRYLLGQRDPLRFYAESYVAEPQYHEADVPARLAAPPVQDPCCDVGKPQSTASVPANGGWVGTRYPAPEALREEASVTGATSATGIPSAIRRNGSTSPNTWYRNEAANVAYAREALDGGRLTLPVLFLHARYDVVVDTVNSRLAHPMRAACADLTEATFEACHFLPKERPHEVNHAIATWLNTKKLI